MLREELFEVTLMNPLLQQFHRHYWYLKQKLYQDKLLLMSHEQVLAFLAFLQ